MDRDHWARRSAALDPETEFHEIYRILATLEFPWDITQALGFALYRTYAVPSIGSLLARTGEFTNRVQKRYDDTVLLLDAVMVDGVASPPGRAAVRRINQMHGAYGISDDDMRYVLSTFVVVPGRWLDDFGWRRLTSAERTASANYYRELGRHLGIPRIPATYQQFADLLHDYETQHFAFDPGGRAVADATLDLMTTFSPNRLMPPAITRRFARTLMDDALLDALHYPKPSVLERFLGRGMLKSRARVVAWMPPRERPMTVEESPNLRTYPQGCPVEQLGTFPTRGASPSPSPRRPEGAPGAR